MKTRIGIAVLLLATAGANPASAEVYAGLGLSRAEHSLANESDTGFTIFAGVRLTDRIVLEGGPVYPGRIHAGEPAIKGFSVQAVGFFPVGENFEFLAKAGYYDWEVDRGLRRLYDGRDPMFGIGIERKLNDVLALRVGLDRFTDVRNGDIDWLSFSVIRTYARLME